MSLETEDRAEVIHALKAITMELDYSLYTQVNNGAHELDWEELADIFMEHFGL